MKYTVVQGDSLRMIAQRELGDAELWSYLAEFNNLQYPYISDTPSAGVLTFGDTLNLPIEEVLEVEQTTSFGTDLKLTTDRTVLSFGKGGDLVVGVNGDYDLVSEMDCLSQDLLHRTLVEENTVPYHSSYGSKVNTMIGSKKDENWRIKTEIEFSRMAKCDPRIVDVTDIVLRDISTGIRIDYTAVTREQIVNLGGGLNDEEI